MLKKNKNLILQGISSEITSLIVPKKKKFCFVLLRVIVHIGRLEEKPLLSQKLSHRKYLTHK